MTTDNITIMAHPGTLTESQLADLMHLVDCVATKSPEYVSLVRHWIDTERMRRESDDETPPEPHLLQVGASRWTDTQLGHAIVAAFVAYTVSDDSSEPVRDVVKQVAFVLTCWAGMRLKRDDESQ